MNLLKATHLLVLYQTQMIINAKYAMMAAVFFAATDALIHFILDALA